MSIKMALAALACAVTFGAANTANAATLGTISVADGNSALVPLGLGTSLSGYFDANLYLTGLANIRATVLGAEAGFSNTFTFSDSDETFSYAAAGPTFAFPVGGLASQTLTNVAAGLLNFSFLVNGGPAGVVNGSNPVNTLGLVNFFVSFLPDSVATSGQRVLLFLDDAGGGAEDNHDDMVVLLEIVGGRIAPVPVPAAGLLLLGALGGLAALRRRKPSTLA